MVSSVEPDVVVVEPKLSSVDSVFSVVVAMEVVVEELVFERICGDATAAVLDREVVVSSVVVVTPLTVVAVEVTVVVMPFLVVLTVVVTTLPRVTRVVTSTAPLASVRVVVPSASCVAS